MKGTVKRFLLLALLCCTASATAEESVSPTYGLPDGFCYVQEVIPDVLQDIRYAGSHNFVGDVIDGYEAPIAIMTKKAAAALRGAADEFREMGYRILIYDAYRPQRAVKHFLRWSKDNNDLRMQEEFYPEYKKKSLLVDQGYIARNSSHTRGSALDMTLVDGEGNTLDMGTCFDYFGKKAWHGASGLTQEQQANRELLKSVMEKHGFKAFEKEWWHYRLRGEPFPDASFDFPVK